MSPGEDDDPRRTLAIGIGSPHGDDQVGWLVMERLAALELRHVRVRLAQSPVEILEWLDGAAEVVICDACQSSGPIGTVRRWAWPAQQLAVSPRRCSHDISLTYILAFAAELRRLPEAVTVWGVEVGDLAPGSAPSDAVLAGVPELVRAIADSLLSTQAPCHA